MAQRTSIRFSGASGSTTSMEIYRIPLHAIGFDGQMPDANADIIVPVRIQPWKFPRAQCGGGLRQVGEHCCARRYGAHPVCGSAHLARIDVNHNASTLSERFRPTRQPPDCTKKPDTTVPGEHPHRSGHKDSRATENDRLSVSFCPRRSRHFETPSAEEP